MFASVRAITRRVLGPAPTYRCSKHPDQSFTDRKAAIKHARDEHPGQKGFIAPTSHPVWQNS